MSLRKVRHLLLLAIVIELALALVLLIATFTKPAPFASTNGIDTGKLSSSQKEEPPDVEFDYEKLATLLLQRPLFDPPPEPVVTPPPPPVEPPPIRVLATFTGSQPQAMFQSAAGATYIKNLDEEFEVADGTVKIVGVTANSVTVQFKEKAFDLKLESSP